MTIITKEFNDPGNDTESVLFSNRFVGMFDETEYRTYLYPESMRDAVIKPIDGTIVLEAL